jgi:hypothetical protein
MTRTGTKWAFSLPPAWRAVGALRYDYLVNNLTPAEAERFHNRYAVSSGGCWLWQGPLDRDGYGTFYLRRKNRRAHRVAWFSLNGPIPDGHVVNHVCRKRSCVNPQHLTLVTRLENVMRDSASLTYINSQKVACPRGHKYDGEYVNRRTGKRERTCSICHRAKARRLREKWRAEDNLAV